MTIQADDPLPSISQADREELTQLINALALSDRTLTIFAIAPESAPDHPVVRHLQGRLGELDEPFQCDNFFYSEDSLYNYLYRLDRSEALSEGSGRRLIMTFGLDQLDTPRLVRELKQLNLGREAIFNRNLVLIFWLNSARFLNEFRDRAPDFWDWRGNVVNFETHPTLNPLLYLYLDWLIAENSHLKISGVMQVNRQVDILLDQIYVSLQAERRFHQATQLLVEAQRESLVPMQSRLKTTIPGSNAGEYEVSSFETIDAEISATKVVTERVDLAEVVRNHSCSVILGTPGAGKTTLLRYLALHFARAKRDGQETVGGSVVEEYLGPSRLPIFLRIANYAERLEQQPDLSLLNYVCQFYNHWKDTFGQEPATDKTEFPALLLTQMRLGRCLLLLDGLDEVFDQMSRRQIVERINDFVEMFGSNHFVVTSRIAGYQEMKLNDRFVEFTITDMTGEQVEQFLRLWGRAIERAQQPEASEERSQREGDYQAQRILTAIQKNEGVKRLTANPLLLTILALIHRNGERLPERRVKLYELAVQTLTADWQLSKQLPGVDKALLPEGEVVELLAPLAYWMHEEKPSGLVTEDEIKQQLAPKLAELRGEEANSELIQDALDNFLRRVRETTGLFVERAPSLYGFMHLTFEEYFAARHIANNDVEEISKNIIAHLDDSRWDEPNILALSFLSIYSSKQFDKVLQNIFEPLFVINNSLTNKWGSFFGNLPRESKFIQIVLLPFGLLTSISLPAILKSSKGLLRYFDLYPLHQLGLRVISEIEIVGTLRFKFIQSLLFSACCIPLILESLSSRRYINYYKLIPQKIIPESLRRKIASYDYSDFNQLTSNLLTATKETFMRANGINTVSLKSEALDYLRSIAINKSIFELIRNNAQKLFIDISSGQPDATLLQSSDTDFEQLISSLPKQSIALAYCQRADINRNAKKYQEAIADYQLGIQLYGDLGQEQSIANCWYTLSECYKDWGKYEQALEAARQYLLVCQTSGDQFRIACAYNQQGQVYQTWGQYGQAIEYYQQSRDLYKQLGRENNVADQWSWLADCYRDWGKYEQAIECEFKDLKIRQTLQKETELAIVYWRFGSIYQTWGQYGQAIEYYQQSCDLYKQLGRENDVARLWYWLASCYRDLKDYPKAIECYQQSLTLHQKLDQPESVAWRYLQIANTQRLQAKDHLDNTVALSLLVQAKQAVQQVTQHSTAGDYKENLAYAHTSLSLLCSEHLRRLPASDPALPDLITQFEQAYTIGLTILTELGQTVNRAYELLDIARAYLEVPALENLDRAETLAREALQVFQTYNRLKLEASTHKLLGEIYLSRANRNQPGTGEIASQFLKESLQIYHNLGITQKAIETEQILLDTQQFLT